MITLTKTYIDWLMVCFDDIKAMIYQINLYKHMKLDSLQQFKEMLDEKIIIILDKLNLRTFSKSTMFNLDDYKSFISTLDENIYEMKVYECFNEHYEIFNEEMLHMPVIEFVFLSEFFPDSPELIKLGSLINHGHDERLLLYSSDDTRKQV